MRDRIAKNAQANRRVDVASDLRPPFQISQRVTFGSLFLFHYSDTEDTTAMPESECAAPG